MTENTPLSKQARNLPVLEKLAALYPHLFGHRFLPLKRGIFQDLLAAHPDAFETASLKDALAFHTRSTRYLSSVAAGHQRHDLQGQAVEVMAPEHVHHALLEVHRRRSNRKTPTLAPTLTAEDLRTQLMARIVQNLDASGLTREAYAEKMRGRDEAANAILDEALALVIARDAKDEALLRAFNASGQSEVAFADMYGMPLKACEQSLARARQRLQLSTPAGSIQPSVV